LDKSRKQFPSSFFFVFWFKEDPFYSLKKMSKSQIYPLTKRPQLIDLNGEHVNFRLEFQVKSIKSENEFQAIVLTQEQLDSVDLNKIEMKQAKGKINGNITANNNKYQNYFLVLKKKEEFPDHEVEVDIHLDQIPGQSTPMETENFTARVPSTPTEEEATVLTEEPVLPFYRRPWFGVLVLIVLLGVGYFLYNFVYLKKPFLWFNKMALLSPAVATGATSATVPALAVANPQGQGPASPSSTVPMPVTVATPPMVPMQAVVENGMESILSEAPSIQINHPVENQIYTKLSQIASL
jgi:hypothetical protein